MGNDLPMAELFDRVAEAKRLRDAGVAQVEAHAPADWKVRAMAAVMRVCRSRATFICDDVWAELADDDRPPEPRALGAVILACVRAGWCRRTDEYRPSSQPQCHANPRRVWRSLLIA